MFCNKIWHHHTEFLYISICDDGIMKPAQLANEIILNPYILIFHQITADEIKLKSKEI